MSYFARNSFATLSALGTILLNAPAVMGFDWVWAHHAGGSGTAHIFDGGGVVGGADSTTSPTDEWMRFYASDDTGVGTGQTGFRTDGDSHVFESQVELELQVKPAVDYRENEDMPFGGTGYGSLSSTFEFFMPLDTVESSYYLWQQGIGYDLPLASSATAYATSPDLNDNGVPDQRDPLVPPALPALEEHQARKHRYVSIDPGTNGANPVALKVTLTSMKRCGGSAQGHYSCDSADDCPMVCDNDPLQWCSSDTVCGTGNCVQSGPCVEHPDVGLIWWVQEPQQNPAACIPTCTDHDWYARVEPDNKVFRVWTLDTLHIGDCEILPVASYELRACLPPDGSVCSDPFTIGTIQKPGPYYYGDVAGSSDLEDPDRFTPPDGIVNIHDLKAYLSTKRYYGTGQGLMAHPTWVDLEGEGSVPQYVINAADLQQIKEAAMGRPYTKSAVNRQPGECNPVCPNARCDIGETPCNCPQDCGSPPDLEGNCDDALDEDCDGKVDCEDTDCASDEACTSPRERVIEWVPVDSTGAHSIAGNTMTVSADSQVRLHLKISGWDLNLDGDPTLGAVQGRVDAAGYSSGDGAPLVPLGSDTGIGFQGAFQALAVCTDAPYGCGPEQDLLGRCFSIGDCAVGQLCMARCDYVFYNLDSSSAVSTTTLNYTWEAVTTDCDVSDDDGEAKYVGTLVLEVPADADGTYSIGFDTDANQTFFTDCAGAPIPGLTTVPAQITVCPGGLVPPVAAVDPEHQARKNRYVSISPNRDCPFTFALQVTLTSMNRCSGDLSRACTVDDDCEAAVPGSGTCIEHPDVGTTGPWWVQAPQQEPLGCIPGPCGDDDWFARVDSVPHFEAWRLGTLHIGDCEMIPVATYEIRACTPPDGLFCSDPLTIGTIEQPFVSPGFRGNYGDAVGPVDAITEQFTPPDGFTNVVDVSAYILTKQNYGTANTPQTHPTWVDLHGLGDGNPPQYILNVSDLGQILKAFAGDAWIDDPGNMDPGQCP